MHSADVMERVTVSDAENAPTRDADERATAAATATATVTAAAIAAAAVVGQQAVAEVHAAMPATNCSRHYCRQLVDSMSTWA